ncbi:hypothetical protein HJFPF1_01734 [Paramyrothecium foliicola]|nr:hypothetical protein HJFPF1_01734 [Paramyrothecium foliicola]
MVKPPTISIRRLMPHRRTGSDGSDNVDESSADEHELRLRSNSFNQQSSQTWLPQNKTKGAVSPRGIRKAATTPPPRGTSPLPYISSSMPNTNFDSDPFRPGNRKAAAVLGVPPRGMPVAPPRRPARPSNGHLGLDESVPPRSPRPTPTVKGKRTESPLPPQGMRAESPRLGQTLRSESPLPVYNLNESRPASPMPPTGRSDSRSESPMPYISLADARLEQVSRQERRRLPTPPPVDYDEDWSENVMQLIQETDQAFRAVGSALEDAKLASYSFERTSTPTPPPVVVLPAKELPPLPKSSLDLDDKERPISPTFEVPIVIARPPTPPTIEHESQTARAISTPPRKISTPEPSPSPSPSATSTPNSTTSTPNKPNTPTMRNQTPAKSKTKRNKGWPAMSQAMAARLGLSGNVTDILTGQRFKKIEVDEMLTSDQIKELKKLRDDDEKQRNERSKQTRASEESQRSASLDRAKGRSSESLQELPSQPDSTDSEYEDEVYEEAYEEWSRKVNDTNDGSSNTTKFPPRKQSRLASQMPEISALQEEVPEVPKIPEMYTDPAMEEKSAKQALLESLMSEEDDEYLYLKSTPYTMTNPCFKHGKIILSKVELNKVKMTVDDTMDWTAFQMAILGGAGDLMMDLYNDDDDIESDLVDDVSEWFETFGFDSFGELVAADSRSGRDSAQSVSSDSSFSSVDADTVIPLSITSESPTSFWQDSVNMPLDTNKFLRSSGLKRWSAMPESRSKISHTRDSSLPTSPMMPLVVGGIGSDSVIDESMADGNVPMGYNLGHDLGDFLRWEAEQMCGSGFYGAPRA